ncbi:GNAT family N-acetyltransferase [Glycomyces sp. L485]|uniref:GNAT family N-acetyltransferase n=1 Tax=Glycomyces sp. L485 TaxID=2909235 RepID=UPI001F4A168F|nr:GNAT family N-acetyltransferase [Glycomyces sp. L485]
MLDAEPAFDYTVDPEATQRFLRSPEHHLLVAYDSDKGVGFVSGVEITHPDKGTEMFLNELAVLESHHRRGIGRALIEALAALARERGCSGMWVLTERSNPAAMATYRAAGGTIDSDNIMIDWRFDDRNPSEA